MRWQMDEKLWSIILAILQRGNDAVIRKKGDGFVVLEDKKTIVYRSPG